MKYFTYVLKNKDGLLYKGVSLNVHTRVKEHNTVKGKWTSNRGPWELVYFEEFDSKAEALRRENFFKSGQGRQLLKELMNKSASA